MFPISIFICMTCVCFLFIIYYEMFLYISLHTQNYYHSAFIFYYLLSALAFHILLKAVSLEVLRLAYLITCDAFLSSFTPFILLTSLSVLLEFAILRSCSQVVSVASLSLCRPRQEFRGRLCYPFPSFVGGRTSSSQSKV